MYSTESITSFLGRARKRLDQELDATTNFWSQAEMLEYMNEGTREVWQTVRETHQNWFVKQLRSTDGIKKIGGRDYDCLNLRISDNKQILPLPPDFYELLLFEGTKDLSQTDLFIPSIILEYANMTQRAFRNDVPQTIPTEIRTYRYRYDIVFGPEGPYIFVAPAFRMGAGASATFDTQMAYIAMPLPLTIKDTFEGTCFTNLMVDALLAYVCYAAAKKEDLVENIQTFERAWLKKQELCSRSAGPKQTRDEETVEGYLETELID